MPHMQPQVEYAEYFEVETSVGTEIVPADVVNRTTETVSVELLLDYLEGKPNDPEAECERKMGWLARLSAPGYLDCTDWSAHATEQEANDYLVEQYGLDEQREPPEDSPTVENCDDWGTGEGRYHGRM